MKSFKQFLKEEEDILSKPIPWKKHYGKNFKVVETPLDQTGGERRISIVTPANGEAWNWTPAHSKTVNRFRRNWNEISKNLEPHKVMQIHTGRNHISTDEAPFYKEVKTDEKL